MIYYLRIENLALMDQVSLEFEAGFHTVTGETGAGKSVLLGALSLLAGNRADKSLIRQGQDACLVEACLHVDDSSSIHSFLRQHDLPACDDKALVLRRHLHRHKPARIHINGASATVNQLQGLGLHWIDFHGPGEPQKLFHEKTQLSLLDNFAQNEAQLAQYQSHYQAWKKACERSHQLRSQDQLSEDELAFYQEQIARIESLPLSAEFVLELESNFQKLQGAQDIASACQHIEQIYQDENRGLQDGLRQWLQQGQCIQQLDSSSQELVQRMEALLIEAEDIAQEYQSLADSADFDEEAAAQIQEHMQEYLSLKRKYHGDWQIILQKKAQLAEKVAQQGNVEGHLQEIRQEMESHATAMAHSAQALHQSRQQAGQKLAQKVVHLLKKLGFKQAGFAIELSTQESFGEYGNSAIAFLFSANAGQAAMPLAKIASSGETARVMLALKSILAQSDQTPVLVFDEVDANIGGEIGKTVGYELAQLAQDRQLFCITHLPQVASQGQHHWLVHKEQSQAHTRVAIEALVARDKRIEELARMLGDRQSTSAQQHAEELLT